MESVDSARDMTMVEIGQRNAQGYSSTSAMAAVKI
jgi:hypothetical protein